MVGDNDLKNEQPYNTQPDEFKAFTRVLTQVMALMQDLSEASRTRLLRTLATMFDQHLPNAPLGVVSSPHHGQLGLQGSGSASGSFSEDRTTSPKQFMLDKRPQTDVERVACLAYYLTHYRGINHFKTLDLSQLNTEAAQIKLSNPTNAVDNATRAGLLVHVGQAKKQLSAIGELYVQALPDRSAAKESVKHARRPRRTGKSRQSTNQSQDSEE